MANRFADFYSSCAFAKGKPPVACKIEKQRDEEAEIKACYARVDERDGRRCKFPGCKRAMTIHHHIEYRSKADRAVKHTSANVTSLCARCNSWVHGGLVSVTGNANVRLRWRLTQAGRDAKIRIPERAV
jgi:hypothetical protein